MSDIIPVDCDERVGLNLGTNYHNYRHKIGSQIFLGDFKEISHLDNLVKWKHLQNGGYFVAHFMNNLF